jgi:hypothetical protein
MAIKDKNNNTLTTEREQYLRWKEHFQEVLNRKDPDELAIISEAPIRCYPFFVYLSFKS